MVISDKMMRRCCSFRQPATDRRSRTTCWLRFDCRALSPTRRRSASECVTIWKASASLVSFVASDDGALLLTDAEFAYFVTSADYRASLGIVDLP